VPQGANKSYGAQQQRRSCMAKKKIAESIIIRVGGGIREIRREPLETQDVMSSADTESEFEQSEEMHSFRPEPGAISPNSKNKTIN